MAAANTLPLVFLHTHWDREWYAPFRVFQIRLAEVLDAVLDRLDAGTLPCFTLDGQTCLLGDYLELRPHQRERLAAHVQSGLLSVGPWFVAPDEFLVSGESLIRNLQRGLHEARAWGTQRFTGYLPDTFGHSADMPALLQGFGIDSAIVWRGVNPPSALFAWESPDGSRVRTLHLSDGYFQNMLHDPLLSDAERIDALRALAAKLTQAAAPYPALIPLGGDHLGPPPPERLALLRQTLGDLKTIHPAEWFDHLPPEAATADLPVIRGELRDNTTSFILPGVYSARMWLKQANRALEHRLTRVCEPLAAMAQWFSPPNQRPHRYHAEIAKAWELLLLNQAHDSIGGCSVDAVHQDNENRFAQADQILDALAVRDARALDAALCVPPDCWLVTNTGDRPYTGPVLVEADGNDAETGMLDSSIDESVLRDAYQTDFCDVPQAHRRVRRATGTIWVDNLPPFSANVIPRTPALRPPDMLMASQSPTCIENDFLRVSLGENGRVDVLDKRTDVLYGNWGRRISRETYGDAYNYRGIADKPLVCWNRALSQEKDAWVRTSCAYTAAHIALQATLAESPIRHVRLMLTPGSPVLQVAACLSLGENAGLFQDTLFQACFNTGTPVTRVLAETHLGVVERCYDPDYSLADQPPAEKGQERVTNTGPIQRFVMANGQCWLTGGLTEYEVSGNELRLTLLRTFDRLSREDTGVRGAHAGPPLRTPGAVPDSAQFFAWAPIPPDVDPVPWAYEQAARFGGVVQGAQGRGPASGSPTQPLHRSLIAWDNPAIVSMACTPTGNGRGLVLRLLNVSDAPQTITLRSDAGLTQAVWADLNDTPLADEPPMPLTKALTLPPRALRTLLLRR